MSNGNYDTCLCSSPNTDGDTPLPDSGDLPDSSTGDEPAVDSSIGPFTPAKLAGLGLWLDDTVGVVLDKGNNVRRWLDQSGLGNNAENPNYQNAEFTVDPSVINGHDALVPPGAGIFWDIADGPSLQFGTGDFLVGLVIKTPGGTAPKMWSKTPGSPLLEIGQDNSTNYYVSVSGVTQAVLPNPAETKFHIVIATGAAMQLRVDGKVALGPKNMVDISGPASDTRLFIGGSVQTEVAEVVAVKGTVSSADVSKLETYWKTKFKL